MSITAHASDVNIEKRYGRCVLVTNELNDNYNEDINEDLKYGMLSYVKNKDNTVTITGCSNRIQWVDLSGKIENMPIKSIADGAFRNRTGLTYVTIGPDIKIIGNNAFENTGISYIKIPQTIQKIGSNAFSHCKNLTRADIYSKSGEHKCFGKDIFKNSNESFKVYCAKGSCTAKYMNDNKIKCVQNHIFQTDYKSSQKVTNNTLASDTNKKYNKSDKSENKTSSNNTQTSDLTNSGTYVRTTEQDWYNRVKRLKPDPENLSELKFDYEEEKNGYRFVQSGMFITKSDYIILCNCVAQEYGADWVPISEMALVAEVVFNTYAWGYSSLYEDITYPNRFEGSETYSGLDHFSGKVNNRVIYAVNFYLSYPEYFNEGYTSFRGDGKWNYFW